MRRGALSALLDDDDDAANLSATASQTADGLCNSYLAKGLIMWKRKAAPCEFVCNSVNQAAECQVSESLKRLAHR